MQIEFHETPQADGPRLVARIAVQDQLPEGLPLALSEGAKAARFTGKAGQIFEGFHEESGKVSRVALVGVGKRDDPHWLANLEKAGSALSAKYLTSGEESLALDFQAGEFAPGDIVAVLMGLRLRSWRWDNYRTKLRDDQKPTLVSAVAVGSPEGSDTAWTKGAAVAEGVELARELVSEPANIIYPESFVARCRARFEGTGVTIRVLGEAEMAALGMGALLGVSQGSVRDAQLLVMEWHGGAPETPNTVLVGKGVTFDTGGISIKPAAGMEDMKWDMGGAGAVAGAMLALAKRGAKANVIGVCGLVENMPDGAAQRPGDVVTSMSGQTIEVINTDAEGRLVLCDAITWAQKEYSPVTIVDFATLTGAMIIALGTEHGGVFSNDDALAGSLLSAGLASGEKLWRFPLSPAYDAMIDSPIADMKNVGPRGAGSITAAQFIQRFVDDGVKWAHCDIAGMVWADKPGASFDKGATGYGVRLIDRFVRDTLES